MNKKSLIRETAMYTFSKVPNLAFNLYFIISKRKLPLIFLTLRMRSQMILDYMCPKDFKTDTFETV